MIMNSWKSTVFAACFPPFKIFIMGTGRSLGEIPPKYRYRGSPSASAAALATAMDTASMALAPKLLLLSVPSVSRRILSIRICSRAFSPSKTLAIFSSIFFTACCTPRPKYLVSPSLSSTASNCPVLAPEGTAAIPFVHLAVSLSFTVTTAATVGFPLESRISLPCTSMISRYFSIKNLLTGILNLLFPR